MQKVFLILSAVAAALMIAGIIYVIVNALRYRKNLPDADAEELKKQLKKLFLRPVYAVILLAISSVLFAVFSLLFK